MLTFIVVQLIGDSPFLQTANAGFYVTLNGAPSASEEEPGTIDRELRKLLESYGSLMTFEKQEVRHFFSFSHRSMELCILLTTFVAGFTLPR